jgi:HCO3- transporter family
MDLSCSAGNYSHLFREVSACSAFRSHIDCFDHVYSVLPGIAFSLDLIETTQQYGVSEVLLSSFMAAFVFSVFGAQPLCIAGVTGLSLVIPDYSDRCILTFD